jgi:serine/threonine protein phosphatase PrpC
MLSDSEISNVLAQGASPQESCPWLIDEANRRGGKDNITAVVGRFAASV